MRKIEVEIYFTRKSIATPINERDQRDLIAEFNRITADNALGLPINPQTWDSFVDPDDGEFDIAEFAEWVETVWEFANFALGNVGSNKEIHRLSELFGALIIDIDGDLASMGSSDLHHPNMEPK